MGRDVRSDVVWRVVVLFIFPAIVIVGLAVYVYTSQKKDVFLETSVHERGLVKTGKIAIERSLDGVKNDISFLSHYHEFRNYVNSHRDQSQVDFINDFHLLMNNRRVYDQIRWIDETGMEKFRIDYHSGHPSTKLPSELQNKKDRYYFKESAVLPEGVIYISAFDLNVDNEKIELPYKPMVRFATVLIDIHGDRRGIFIINYLGSDLLQRFERVLGPSFGVPMLLNHEGYFLKGKSAEDEWGFMRGRSDLTLAHRHPLAWKHIAREDHGEFENEEGLWTFSTVNSPYKTRARCTSTQNCGWKVVTFVSADVLYGRVDNHLKIILGATLVGLMLAGVASFGLVFLYRKKEKAMNDFRNLQKRTEGILLSVPDIIMQVDTQKRYVWANTQGLKFFGGDVIGKEASEYFEGEQETYASVHPVLMGDIDFVYVESWQRRYDEKKRLLAWWCRNLKDEEGNVTGMLSTARDITEEYEREKEIEKLSKALEQIDDIVYITDKFGNISYANSAYSRHTGYARDEVIGQNAKISKSGMHNREFYKELWTTILSGEVYRKTLINRKKNGDLYYEKKTITPLKDDRAAIIGFISTGKDVTEEEMLNQKIERIATIDNLTKIYNRHKFEELFMLESERARRFTQPLSLILIDIDHFKLVNDTYGHDVGDKVLVHLTGIVQENIRKIDIFARWGGEEFLVLCPGTQMDNVKELAEKLRDAVEKTPFEVVGKITISIGVSVLNPEDSFSELFKRADQGLYYAKENGRNRIGAVK